MSAIAVIGEPHRVEWAVLGGALVYGAADAEAVRAAWGRLDPSVAVIIVTPQAAAALEAVRSARAGLLWAVMPE